MIIYFCPEQDTYNIFKDITSSGFKISTNYQINDHLGESNEVWKITTSNYISHYCKVFKTGKSLAKRFNMWGLNALKV